MKGGSRRYDKEDSLKYRIEGDLRLISKEYRKDRLDQIDNLSLVSLTTKTEDNQDYKLNPKRNLRKTKRYLYLTLKKSSKTLSLTMSPTESISKEAKRTRSL